IEKYNRRTGKSKAHTQQYREALADNRGLEGFRLPLKDLIYTIVSCRSSGPHFWDLDGNEYVDMTMGFGVHMFGHSPAFVTTAIRNQIEAGFELGPQSFLAGRNAEAISALTGMPRVAFCCSGTEAVMTAVRLARLVTGRDKVAIF